jgi:hypothetical protein
MRRFVNALNFAIALAGLATAEDLNAQACQGCTCAGSSEVHPVPTLKDCNQGCSILELICENGDIIPTTTVIGLGFGGPPKSVPKECKVLTIPLGGILTGKPASGCAKGEVGK